MPLWNVPAKGRAGSMRGPNGEEMQAGVTGLSNGADGDSFATAEGEHSDNNATAITAQERKRVGLDKERSIGTAAFPDLQTATDRP